MQLCEVSHNRFRREARSVAGPRTTAFTIDRPPPAPSRADAVPSAFRPVCADCSLVHSRGTSGSDRVPERGAGSPVDPGARTRRQQRRLALGNGESGGEPLDVRSESDPLAAGPDPTPARVRDGKRGERAAFGSSLHKRIGGSRRRRVYHLPACKAGLRAGGADVPPRLGDADLVAAFSE
jgi:hypothetical protein